jgi:phage terminase small subunit
MNAIVDRPDWDYGPAMMRLNERQRNFVVALLTGKPGHGCLTRAYIAAGYQTASRSLAGKAAYNLSRDEKVLAAISEESKKLIRVHYPEASLALLSVIRNPDHRDHVRAIGMVLDRVDPINTHHSMTVVHKWRMPGVRRRRN